MSKRSKFLNNSYIYSVNLYNFHPIITIIIIIIIIIISYFLLVES